MVTRSPTLSKGYLAYKKAHEVLRDRENRRREKALEEGKKEQARLLSSAKVLYKTRTTPTTGSSSSSTSSSVFTNLPGQILFGEIQGEGRREYIRLGNVPEEQCLVVRALLSCDNQPNPELTQYIMTKVLHLPLSASSDKLYKAGARLVHPDKCRHPDANSAFRVLSSLYKPPS